MSLGLRGFVEFLIDKVESEGILGDGYSSSEREEDVIDMIWDAYKEWNKE